MIDSAHSAGDMVWMFTLGQPEEDLMMMLGELTATPIGMNWILVPVPEAPGLDSLREPLRVSLVHGS